MPKMIAYPEETVSALVQYLSQQPPVILLNMLRNGKEVVSTPVAPVAPVEAVDGKEQ